MEVIRFGTDGWRAKMSGPFNVPNVRRAAFGLGKALGKRRAKVFVGYDTRRNSGSFAREAALVLASLGHRTVLSTRLLPTPALALAVKRHRADAGVMITASHNSGAYNGFKIKLPPGVSAPVEFTRRVERSLPKDVLPPPPGARLKRADWLGPYLRTIASKVDLRALRKTGLRIVVDSMHGTGERHFEGLFAGGRTKVRTIAWERKEDFAGRRPEPIAKNLLPLSRAVRKARADVGFATDGDGDRVGMTDEKGRFVDVHKLHALLLYHLHQHRGQRGAVVKTVSGTLMVERMARDWGLPLFETPIGFKHIGAVMLKEDVLLGLEESGGIAFKGHLPERDGLLSALMLTEALAALGKTVSGAVAFLQEEFGPFHSARIDVEDIPSERQARILGRLRKSPPSRLAGRKVLRVGAKDGIKFLMEDAWLLVRASGTEPLLRLYAEAPSRRDVDALLAAARREVQRG